MSLHEPAYLATANWSKPGQPQPSLGILHTGTKKENRCLGREDLKSRTQELSAGHVFYHTEEGSLLRENEANIQRQKKNAKSI